MNENKRDDYKGYLRIALVIILITLTPLAFMVGYELAFEDVSEYKYIDYDTRQGMIAGFLLAEIICYMYLASKYNEYNEPFEMIEWLEKHNEFDDIITKLITEREET